MANQKVVSMNGSIKTKQIDGERRILFVASSAKTDRHHEHVDVKSLRLPLKGGGDMRVDAIPSEGVEGLPDIPLMVNHSADAKDIIGSVRNAYYSNDELIFEAGISKREIAQEMLTLIEEGHLSNAFSITMVDFKYHLETETISDAEVIEVSLVYRGSNKEARLLAIKSLTEGNMNKKELTNPEILSPIPEVPASKPTVKPVEPPVEPKEEVNNTPAEPTAEDNTEQEPAKEVVQEANESEENTMNETNKKIAVDGIVEKGAMPVQESKAADNYLSTKAAMKDYAKVLFDHAGEDGLKVKEAWKAFLAKEKGITNPEILLPVTMIQYIEDAFENAGDIWPLLNKTGLTVRRIARDTNVSDTARARGHKRGEDKNEQQITLADRIIRAQYIYKYLTLNKEDIRENQDTGALIEYVLRELPNRVVTEIERAVMIGDGRPNTDDDKVTSFLSIKDDAADTNSPFATRYVPEAGEDLFKSIVKADAQVTAGGARYLVISRAKLAELRLSTNNGGLVFPLGSNVAGALGFAGVITPEWFTPASDANNQAYVVTFNNYDTVGDRTPESFTNFMLKTNKQEFLNEIYAGGALAAKASAVAIANTP